MIKVILNKRLFISQVNAQKGLLAKILFGIVLMTGSVSVQQAYGLDAARKSVKKRHPLFRLDHPVSHMKLSAGGRYLAFKEDHPVEGGKLKYLDFKTKKIFLVTQKHTGAAFEWAPHGYRLIFRTQSVGSVNHHDIISQIMVRDVILRKNIPVRTIPGRTGLISIDPYDFRLRIMGEQKLYLQKINYPGSRLAKWQKKQKSGSGFWVGTQKGVLWLGSRGTTLERLPDDGSPLESLSVSPDGQYAVWSTKKGKIFWHTPGKNVRFLDYGRSPAWHPRSKSVLYSGAHQTGPVSAGYDLKWSHLNGQKVWITNTPYSQENWPVWLPNENLILFTVDHTTDLFLQDLKNEIASRTVRDSG